MYRRLVTFALLVVTVAVTALVIPLALSARDLVRSANLAAHADQARILADAWEDLAKQKPSDESSGGSSDDSSGGCRTSRRTPPAAAPRTRRRSSTCRAPPGR